MLEWVLDPDATHLNHGSFGACPRPVLEAQQWWRDEMERNPVRFMDVTLQPAIDAARDRLAAFLGTRPAGLAFVTNATTGVNAVLRSLEPTLGPGDELVVTDHAYNACRNAFEVTALRTGARLITASVPFPIGSADAACDAVLHAVTDRTRLVLLDHVTSPTALVMPVERLLVELEPDVPVLLDGAHAAGMVPFAIDDLGASYAVGNCHKWLCAPKGAGYLAVRADRIDATVPTTVSHGWNAPLPHGGSRYHALFDWVGTDDPTPRLSVATAIDVIESSHPGGWRGVMAGNRALAIEARGVVCEALGVEEPAPDDMIGSMAALVLPDAVDGGASVLLDPLTATLRERWQIEVPVFTWPDRPRRLIRLSAQSYNGLDDYRRLAEALVSELG